MGCNCGKANVKRLKTTQSQEQWEVVLASGKVQYRTSSKGEADRKAAAIAGAKVRKKQ